MAAASRVARAAFSRHLRAFCVGCRTYEGNLGRAARTALVGRRGVSSNIEGPEHVVVIGGGALGSLFAGRLGALNALRGRVWMLTSWEEQAAAVESNQGVVVQEQGSVGSGCLIGEVRAMRHLAEVRELQTNTVNTKVRGRVNVVIIAVKQTGIRKAAEQAAQILAGVHGGLCITVLNGLGHIEVVNNALRNHDVRATLIHGHSLHPCLLVCSDLAGARANRAASMQRDGMPRDGSVLVFQVCLRAVRA